MTNAERWRDIEGFEGIYQVSDMGRVKSMSRTRSAVSRTGNVYEARVSERIMKGTLASDRVKYHYVVLRHQGRTRSVGIHRLVLEAFVGPCPEGEECLHGPGGSLDNRLGNLRWGTHTENVRETAAAGRHHNSVKTYCPSGHAYADHTYLYEGRRYCRQCQRSRPSSGATRNDSSRIGALAL